MSRAVLLTLSLASALACGVAQAADAYVSATVGAAIAPGVYGRIDIGNAPPPPLIYAQPVIIARPQYVMQPVYMHVPPGHAKNWARHCHKYGACAQPVYFVKAGYEGGHKHRKHKHHD